MKKLIEKLLSLGGKEVLIPEDVPETMIQFGHLYEYSVLKPVGGTSRYFISKEEDVRVIWGFVLDEDDVWKMHSWLVAKNRELILDNEEYKKYYGLVKA